MLDQNIENIKNIILRTVDCEKLYLFGSYAYGTPNAESDYDFYVVVPDGLRPNDVTDSIYHALYRKTNSKAVDILVKKSSDFEGRKSLHTLENEVYQKGVMLYGQ
jgi:predicted nucleotidyltransferase